MDKKDKKIENLEEKIKELESRLNKKSLLLDNSPSLMILTNSNEEITMIEGNTAELYVPIENVLGQKFDEIMPSEVSKIIKKARDDATKNDISTCKYSLDINGNSKTYSLKTKYNNGLYSHTINDITEKIKIEDKLKLNFDVLDQIQDFVTITDLNGNILYANQSEKEHFANEEDELIGESVNLYGEDPNLGATQNEIIQNTMKNGAWRGEIANIDKNGDKIILDCRTKLVYDNENNPVAISGISTDITERKKIIDELKNSVNDKEILIQEIHHRVKNNLQVVRSMLNLQKIEHLDKPELSAIIDEIMSRVGVMSNAYQNIYEQTENFDKINTKKYVERNIHDIINIYSSNNISLKTEIDELSISIDRAIPMGLIVNEVVSNSLKYAFNGSNDGEIYIKISGENENVTELIVQDNGIGYNTENKGFGTNICEALSEQIGMEIELNSEIGKGTTYKMVSKKNTSKYNNT